MCIGRCQRHSQPSNDPDVGLRPCDPRHDRQRGSARCQMQECAAGKFHGGSLNCLREGFRDALSLPVRTNGSPGTSNFSTQYTARPRGGGRTKKADDQRDSRISSSVIHGRSDSGGPTMLTTMTEADWTIVLQIFGASRSRRGDKGRDDRKFLEALHARQSRIDPTPKTYPPSFRKFSTRVAPVSSKQSASSNGSSASRCVARRPRRITPRSSHLLLASS
jgi:hypothetical protein